MPLLGGHAGSRTSRMGSFSANIEWGLKPPGRSKCVRFARRLSPEPAGQGRWSSRHGRTICGAVRVCLLDNQIADYERPGVTGP